MSAWTVKRADRAASPVEVGATVYRCKGWDYGCANDDTRMTKIEHVSVTLDPAGAYPFFTIPREDLEVADAPSGVTATGVSADPGGTETKPEQNLHEKESEG